MSYLLHPNVCRTPFFSLCMAIAWKSHGRKVKSSEIVGDKARKQAGAAAGAVKKLCQNLN